MRNLYKRKLPKRSFHETTIDVLRMSEDMFAQFKGVASHYQGKTVFHEDFPRRPDRKILPSTFETIGQLESPSELAAMLHLEKRAHEDHDKEYHSGGGLMDATTSIFSGLWNNIGVGNVFNDWFGHFDYESPENRIDDTRYAKIIKESYKEKDERDDTLGDWSRDKVIGTDEFSVWVDEDDREVHVSLRGTKMNSKDIVADLKILATNQSGNDVEVLDFLRQVEDKYPDYKLDVSAHSLGGNTLMNVFNDHEDLKFQRVNLFNPGTSPLADLSGARKTIENDKFHFYLNSGDMISNTFATVLPSGRENVYWAKPKAFSPIGNHSIGQWI
jgi:hypothetical protein